MNRWLSRKAAVIAILAVTASALILLLVPATVAEEGMSLAIDEQALTCSLLNRSGVPIEVDAERIKLITTDSVNGNITFQCEAGLEDEPGSAIEFKGSDNSSIACRVEIPPFVTNQWHQTINANNDAKLTCQFKT